MGLGVHLGGCAGLTWVRDLGIGAVGALVGAGAIIVVQHHQRRWRLALVAVLGSVLVLAVGLVGAAWLGHWKLRTVESDSMGAALPRNSLAIVAPTNPRGRDVGDVIAFANPNDRRITTVHRVTERVEQGDAIFYRTQGDANSSSDPMLVPTSDIRGLVRGHVPRIGAAVKNLEPPWTYLALVGLPAALVTRDEVRARRRRRRQPESTAEATSSEEHQTS